MLRLQREVKILKNINFNVIAPLNNQEISLLVGSQGGDYSKESTSL